MNTQACASCRFCRKVCDGITGATGTVYQVPVLECRRYSPRRVEHTSAIFGAVTSSVWPNVKPDDWCGEWAAPVLIDGDGSK